MRYRRSILLALLLACTVGAGCGWLPFNKDDKDDDKSPTSPSPTVSLDQFAGTWTSTSASTPSNGCGKITYTVTPVSTTTANITFAGTCAGNVTVTGNGSGTLQGDGLTWTADGQVSQSGLTCPFSIPTGRATPQDGGLSIAYQGTVCGIPISGTEVVKK
jgi:hypothetical protein